MVFPVKDSKFVFHLHNRDNNKTAPTLACSEVGTTRRPVCDLYPTDSPAHLSDRNYCKRITWSPERHTWLLGLGTTIRDASSCRNCASNLFSDTQDCCSFKISCYIFNCGHLADCLLLLRYCWLLLSVWPQDKANNYYHQKQLVVLYYIEVNYTGIRVDYFYQMGNKLLINSLL